MEKLTYSVTINAPKEKVWNAMFTKETYEQWIKPFSENSTFVGEWKEGSEIVFYDPNMGGTKARIEKFDLYKSVHAVHIGLVDKNAQDEENEYSETWIGATESYNFAEEEGITTVDIVIETHKNFVDMFNGGWDQALVKLKALCE